MENTHAQLDLRHCLATIAYRGGKALRDAPAGFAEFKAGDGPAAVKIVAHMGDLFDWTLNMANGDKTWHESAPLEWDAEVQRFYRSLAALDARLSAPEPIAAPVERLFQGPLADALTHAGQLAMMRRLAGAPTVGENYYVADIVTGRVGAEQATPRRTF